LPQDRYEQLVTEVVTHKVDARVAKQLAGSNPAYAAIIERARRVDPKPWSVKV